MRRYYLGAILLCIFLSARAMANQQAPAPRGNGNTVAASPGEKPAPASYSQEPFVIEQYYTTARFENDGTSQRDLAVRIRVQSDAGVQQLGELVFGYNSGNEQMEVRTVRVRKPDGTIVTAAPDSIKEMTASAAHDAPMYTDYKEKHITVPSLHAGDTIEYEIVTRTLTSLAPGEFWFAYNFLEDAIVLDERLEVDVPQGRAITIRSPEFSLTNGRQDYQLRVKPGTTPEPASHKIPFSKSDENGRTIYHWHHANLIRPPEDGKTKKKEPRAETKRPDVELTTFEGWQGVAQWYAKLEKDRTEPTQEIHAKTLELVRGRENNLDKIQALYDYVAKNIRYVSLSFGLGRYQPHSAADVFANQYGDCKDKHTLLASMLQAAGISSDAVLIPFSGDLDTSTPSPSQFDHVITAVPSADGLLWMDSTAEVAPFRLLSPALRNKSALLVPPDGAGRIIKTPIDPPFLSTQRVEIDAEVSDLGKLSAKLRYFLRGDNELALRVAFRRTPQTQWKELGQTIAALDGIHGDVTSVKPSDPSDTQNPFEIDLEFSQANFLDWSSKKSKVTVPLLIIGMPEAREDATEPIHLGSPLDVTMTLKLKLPSNFTAQAPVAVSIVRDYAAFKSSYRFESHTLVAERTLNFKMRELPASRVGDYRAFTRAVESDESQVLLAENSNSDGPEIPEAANPGELLEAGLAALNSGNLKAAIPLLKRALELDPSSKQGWNNLGLAYLRLGQLDDAGAAFRKQIALNPYDEHVYNYLGFTLQQQRNYTDAAKAFQKQIEVNPIDPVAHAALGALYLEEHKYAEAVPELDKATILSPENAELQVSLGQAYINTGEKEKALAAFEKGVELAQSPAVWNNVAYSLADHQLDIEKAQQYAESAVSTASANLRNVDLSHLSIDDLQAVSNLGVYWDTLGWVHFQKGELQEAERYIRASWLLDQHGEVGDHLAQIEQKRGEKDRAIHMYSLSLGADHSVPETRARLIGLLGPHAKIEDLVNQAKPELTTHRTFSIGKSSGENSEADFLVLLSPGTKDPKVEAVKFVSGNQNLRPFAERLRAVDFGPMFPDATPARIVRRGTLACSATTGNCTFTLILPENLRTVN
jgi:Flp pilus assembly protein TadD/transglutaminase-like putative cysteine protease